jgi:hypothetical protein
MPPRRAKAAKPRARKPRAVPPAPTGERLLALDVSSVCVGWALFEDGRLAAHGRHRQDGKEHGEKLLTFAVWLGETMKKLRPTVVAYEAPYAGRKRYTYGVLMMYVAVMLLMHVQHFGAELPKKNRVAAQVVKRRIRVRKGRTHDENKKIVVAWANETYGLALRWAQGDRTKAKSQDDEADAIAVGHAWLVGRDEPEATGSPEGDA